MPVPTPTPGENPTYEQYYGGIMSEVPLSGAWAGQQLQEWISGEEVPSRVVPAVTETFVDPLVEAAGEQIGTAIVVAGVAGTVVVLGLVGLGLVAWKLS